MQPDTDTPAVDPYSRRLRCDGPSSPTTLPATPTPSLTARLIAGLSCAPDSESSFPQLKKLLLIALSVMSILVAVALLNLNRYAKAAAVPSSIRMLPVALMLAGLCATYFAGFVDRWRRWAMALCIAMVAIFTLIALLLNEDEALAVALVVVLLVTSLLVPWGARRQGILALVNLFAFGIAAMTGRFDTQDPILWVMLLVTAGFGVSFAALKDYSHRQRILMDESRLREENLQAENAHRNRAEARLRVEIDEREAAEKTAKKREAILQKVLATSIDVISINSVVDDRFIYTNGEFSSTGYTSEEASGKTAQALNIWVEPMQYAEYREKLTLSGRVHNMEVNFRMKSGQIVPHLISAVVAKLDGELCVVAMARDITERKKMESDLIAAREDALAASRAKSEFLSSMSHEIRTPMNAVLGMADLLTETKLTGEQRRYIDVMVANGNSLLELINSILDLARIESGRMQIENTEFDLTDLIDKTISTFGVQAHSKGLELVARIAPGVPEHLVGDPLRLRQILINFLGNAIKFTELGQVVLEVDWDTDSTEPTALRFSVSDTGIGIAPAKLDSIFTSFTQADSSTTRKYGGTGLGLAIAQRLVNLMKGRIWVESELHEGSKFSFTARFGLAARVISPSAHVLLSLVNYRVLVVDDNQINRLIAREMISNCGAQVDEAESGEAALDAIRAAANASLPYGIVLLDMRMPGMNGLEVARRIRQEHLPMEPLILMLSSDDLAPQLDRLKELGLDAYLVKPITRKELFEAISRVIRDANRNSADALPERKAQEIPLDSRPTCGEAEY